MTSSRLPLPSDKARDLQVFLVGGAVRDHLLGREVQDRDWVVVGAQASDLQRLGFREVGADFPVFLDPESGDEYALARVERKTGTGYLGFDVRTKGVTLEEDLSRRDLTINAMALAADGTLLDPYHGQADLEDQVLRHVGPAFEEDPVRVLRILRFQARFGPSWTIAPETEALIRAMVAAGRVDELVAERVWKEVSRALMEPHADLLIEGLLKFELLTLPAFHAYRDAGDPVRLQALRQANEEGASLSTRFALAFPPQTVVEFPAAIPRPVRQVARLAQDFPWAELRSPQAWLDVMTAAAYFRGGLEWPHLAHTWQLLGASAADIRKVEDAAASVDAKALAASLPAGPAVSEAIRRAREAAVASVL